GSQFHAHDVAQPARADSGAAVLGRRDIGRSSHDSLSEEEADGELDVVARRAHGHGQAAPTASRRRTIAETDLQRFLRRELIPSRGVGTADPLDLDLDRTLIGAGFVGHTAGTCCSHPVFDRVAACLCHELRLSMTRAVYLATAPIDRAWR